MDVLFHVVAAIAAFAAGFYGGAIVAGLCGAVNAWWRG